MTCFRVVCSLVVGCLLTWHCTHAADDDDALVQPEYTVKTVKELVSRAKIDKSDKPAPGNNYVYPIVPVPSIPGSHPSIISYGAFLTSKNGDGDAIFELYRSGESRKFAATSMSGYGSTDEYWFYELKGLEIDNAAVYIGLPQDVAAGNVKPVVISLGDDSPTHTSSFVTIGYVTRGRNAAK